MKKLIVCLTFLVLFFQAGRPVWAENALLIMKMEGVINPVFGSYMEDAVQKARDEKASAILLELDTPGGLLDATRTIIGHMINSEIPVIVYVSPRGARATSAGVFITLASDVAVMAPETHIGAAHPVNLNGENPSSAPSKKDDESSTKKKKDSNKEIPSNGNVMAEKMVSDAAAYIRTLAKEHGRNADWAEKAVRESVSLTASEAMKEKVIDLVASSRDELIKKLDGKIIKKNGKDITLHLIGSVQKEFPLSPIKKILHMLAHPNVAYILMTIGIYGLIYELAAPGIGLGGAVGAICLLLAFFSLQVLPINAVGLALIALGAIFLVMDIFLPTHGLLTFGGLFSFAIGSFMLIDIKTNPAYTRISLELIISTVASTALFFGLAIRKAFQARRAKPKLGVESLMGASGITQTEISPEGMVFLNGELWTAQSEYPIAKQEEILVTGIQGNKLIIKKKSKETT
jgi:membrane-bound serine protease (ClpP class)